MFTIATLNTVGTVPIMAAIVRRGGRDIYMNMQSILGVFKLPPVATKLLKLPDLHECCSRRPSVLVKFDSL